MGIGVVVVAEHNFLFQLSYVSAPQNVSLVFSLG